MTPTLSIVVPTRNRPELLPGAVESALAQTIGDVEVVVVDDGSVEPVRLAPDPRVRTVRLPESRGLAAALNAGARTARGRWLAHLDDDDRLSPRMAELSLAAIEGSPLAPPVAALSGLEEVDRDGRVLRTRLPPRSRPRGDHYSLEPLEPGRAYEIRNTMVAERSLVLALGGWDERFRARVRHEFFLRLNPVCSLQGIDEVTYRLLDHALTPRVSRDDALKHDTLVLLERTHRELFRSHPRRYAHYLRVDAQRLRRLCRRREAALRIAHALRLDPLETGRFVAAETRARLA